MEMTLASTVDGGKALHRNLLNAPHCNSTSLQMAMPRKKNTKIAQGNKDHGTQGNEKLGEEEEEYESRERESEALGEEEEEYKKWERESEALGAQMF